ncbi:hypothetical protein [Hydrocarboniphaga sp.]|uniref:hypothetical protein n=1 Tax=Hydrocarboniphaga sp. TaxID=2033016 RepID=UPI003D09A7AB
MLTFREFGPPMLDRQTHGVLHSYGHNPIYNDPAGVADAMPDCSQAVERGEA